MADHLILGTKDQDYLIGTDRDDLFIGRAGTDDLFGGLGRDVYFAGSGNDFVGDGQGRSLMFGGTGGDNLSGGHLADTLFGGAGDDILSGNGGNDLLRGGAGDDSINIGGTLSDVAHAFGGAGDDFVTFGSFNAGLGGVAHGGSGRDTVQIVWSGGSAPPGGATIHLYGPDRGAVSATASIDFAGFERLAAFTGDDNDTVTGGAFQDDINLGLGDNLAKGFGGNDYMGFSGGGTNVIDGGDGRDTLHIDNFIGPVNLVVTGTSATDNFDDVLTNFEIWNILGSFKDDSVSLGAHGDFFSASAGNDTGMGRGGDDFLYGGAGRDLLNGGSGDDVLSGGYGLDTLTGGSGADAFHFATPGDLGDLITDFAPGEDRIEVRARLTGVVFPTGTVDPAAFSHDAASGPQPQFVLRAEGDGAILIFDQNGTTEGGEVVVAHFASPVDLTASDILIF